MLHKFTRFYSDSKPYGLVLTSLDEVTDQNHYWFEKIRLMVLTMSHSEKFP